MVELYRSLEEEKRRLQHLAQLRESGVLGAGQGPRKMNASVRGEQMLQAAKKLRILEGKLQQTKNEHDAEKIKALMEDVKMGNARKRVCLDRVGRGK